MGKSEKWTLWVMLLSGAILALGAVLAYPFAGFLAGKTDSQHAGNPATVPDGAAAAAEDTLRERAGWTPQDFFKGDDAIRACEAISARNQAQLQAVIDGGLDVNRPGKAGFTLLHWAFAEDNFEAFDLLLKSGADPNQKLTRFIHLHNGTPFVEGDSILFTCIRKAWKRSQLDFFFAALEHTGEKDPRGWAGKNLLDVVVAERRIDEGILARIVESGVDLDMQTQYGDTAAMWAIRLDRPQLALQILKSGADPSIRNKQGQSVADLILQQLEHEKSNQYYPKEEAARLLEWLQKHPAGGPTADEKP